MIITKILGGLGNQMFQYAAGRALAERLGVELKLDVSGFEGHDLRDYSLGGFNVKENFATKEDVESLRVIEGKQSFIGRVFGKKNKYSPSHIMEKPLFEFNERFLNLENNVFLEGYWQNERYFKDIKSIIRNDFTLKRGLGDKSKELQEIINSSNSVSIHIRRGDYATNPKVNSQYGLCSLDYYQRGIKYLEDKVGGDLNFFIFSDDLQWAKDNLFLDQPVIMVDHNGPESCYEDMILMSRCRHNIIANSTFSWWGAWLNTNKDKTVVAPKKWFQYDKYDTSDLIPKEWVRI